ncbi:MAG: phenylalanine--tRNA ligase subunit alpha, partial [Candidatus Omnitrophica bacterium]|nr:phenylalanine--tRNA ligase subunit alpha [Candidatus Omnitrophota bacterium]
MDIKTLRESFYLEREKIDSLESLQEFKQKFLGRKGLINQLTSGLANLELEERKKIGSEINQLKEEITSFVKERERFFGKEPSEDLSVVDVGLPGFGQKLGRLHPLTQVIREICDIFMRIGFVVIEGP